MDKDGKLSKKELEGLRESARIISRLAEGMVYESVKYKTDIVLGLSGRGLGVILAPDAVIIGIQALLRQGGAKVDMTVTDVGSIDGKDRGACN